jgi:hypothetical protein
VNSLSRGTAPARPPSLPPPSTSVATAVRVRATRAQWVCSRSPARFDRHAPASTAARTAPHRSSHPQLHQLFWEATRAAGDAKKTMGPQAGADLLDKVDEIADIFWATEGGKPDWMSS